MRFAQKEFDVQFVPGEASPDKMVAAVQGLPRGYKARLSRPISASVKGDGVTISGIADRPSYKAGAKAKVKISLKPDRKKKVKKISAKIADGGAVAKGASTEIKSSKGGVLKVTLGDKSGAAHITVELSFEVDGKSQTATIKVPITIG